MPSYDFRCVHLPYCLARQKNGTYVILNRNYKPIGFKTNEHLNYSDYPVEVKFKRFTSATAKILSWNKSPDIDSVLLYDGNRDIANSSEYMQDYLKRLEHLAKLKFDEQLIADCWSLTTG